MAREVRRWRWQPRQNLQRHGDGDEEQGLQGKQTHSSQHQYHQHHEGKGCRSGPADRKNLPRKYSCRPPRAPGSTDRCCQEVPLWEKRFCADDCRIPWWKVCETKRLTLMYPKVREWNDAAGEEAIGHAKCRYWAKINGLPCDAPLPDPDMYNDTVDPDTRMAVPDAHVDPELQEYFNNLQSAVTDDEASEGSVQGEYVVDYKDIPIPVSGWGDEEDPTIPVPYSYPVSDPILDYKSIPISVSGWGDEEDPIIPVSYPYPLNAEYTYPVPVLVPDYKDIPIPISGWGDEEDPAAPVLVSYSYPLDGEYTYQIPVLVPDYKDIPIPVSGWGDEEDLVPVLVHEETVPGMSRKDKSWKQPKDYINQRRGRHGKKRINGG